VVAAAPGYLAQQSVINEPADLARHQIIAMTHFGIDSWTFPPAAKSKVARAVQFAPKLVVNTVRAAVASATEGHGVTRLFSYHIGEEIRDGRLQILLAGTSIRRCRCICLPRRDASTCRRCAPSSISRPAAEALFRAVDPRGQPQRQGHSFAARKSVCE